MLQVFAFYILMYVLNIENVQHKFFRIMEPLLGFPDPFIEHVLKHLTPTLESLREYNDMKLSYKLAVVLLIVLFDG